MAATNCCTADRFRALPDGGNRDEVMASAGGLFSLPLKSLFRPL